jgi:hypothetical protein
MDLQSIMYYLKKMKTHAPRSPTSLRARLFLQISGALPVVGEAVKLATGGAGSWTGEGFF